MTESRPAGAPRIYGDVAELLAGATERSLVAEAAGKSGATLERIMIDGRHYMLKHLDLGEDWTMRASGCLRGAPFALWERGILARLPDCFNQPIVGVLREDRTGPPPAGGCALLMRDVTPWLVPVTDMPIPLDQHAGSSGTWPLCTPRSGTAAVSSMSSRPCIATWSYRHGWPRRRQPSGSDPPGAAAGRQGLAAAGSGGAGCRGRGDPAGAGSGPAGGRPGQHPAHLRAQQLETRQSRYRRRGRTVHTRLGTARAWRGASDLAWYLAINCRRLPQSKEASIGAYRAALEAAGSILSPGGNVSWRCRCWAPGPVRMGEGARRL